MILTLLACQKIKLIQVVCNEGLRDEAMWESGWHASLKRRESDTSMAVRGQCLRLLAAI